MRFNTHGNRSFQFGLNEPSYRETGGKIFAMYDWIKALHVVAVISWMAGMLYLPRLFVYHAAAKIGSELSETLKVMERRLLRFIMNPAMIVTWFAGLYLAWAGNWHAAHWFQAKFMLVILMSGIHGYFAGRIRAFNEDRNQKSQKFYRIINEVPTVLMIAIVVLVVVKPF
jgi:putative membrane protein